MRFTHLAEFSKYAKYQPFKFYLLISVIACFPITYAHRSPHLCCHGSKSGCHDSHDKSIVGALFDSYNRKGLCRISTRYNYRRGNKQAFIWIYAIILRHNSKRMLPDGSWIGSDSGHRLNKRIYHPLGYNQAIRYLGIFSGF